MQTAQSLQSRTFATIAPARGLRPVALLRAPSSALAEARARHEFERAVLPCRAALHATAMRLAKSRADADDLLQETLLRAWRFWPSYREQDHCRAWLQRILNNTFCSNCRSASRRRTQLCELTAMQAQAETTAAAIPVEPEVAWPEERATDTRLSNDRHLASSFAALKPEQRRILSLIDVHDRSYREAARELACPIGTVMSRLHRARRALRLQLDAAAQRA